MVILPELVLLAGALAFFVISLGKAPDEKLVRSTALLVGFATFAAACLAFRAQDSLFHGAYVVDRFSQLFKLLIGFALALLLTFSRNHKDIESRVRPEYFMFQMLSVLGLMMMVSAVELILIFVALELSSFALYLLVPMRDDRSGVRMQMEAGMKYILFGVRPNR